MKNNGDGAFKPKEKTGWTANVYIPDNWAVMEAAGAVFLPAAGGRDNNDGGDYVGYVGDLGFYWSSTPREDNDNFAYDLYFEGNYVNPTSDVGRNGGLSVRLVCGE